VTAGYGLLRPFLYALDTELAHDLALRALRMGVVPAFAPRPDPRLARTLFGVSFPNPLGLAAGLDKNGSTIDGLLRLGLGWVEVGSVTPRAQPGNPRPRLFRIARARALINRYGFNNEGLSSLRTRLEERKGRGGIVGVNLGANKDSADRVADFVAGIATIAGLADYAVINVSSPNTPGLRALQEKESLVELLARVTQARDLAREKSGRPLPVLLKLSPDVSAAQLADIADAVKDSTVDGAIVSNTTLDRFGLGNDPRANEAGGMSGRPLFHRSTVQLARFRKLMGPSFPIVGVGGIDSGLTAWQKFEAGADLVQIYTGMIFEGPGLVGAILRDLSRRLDAERLPSIAAIVGRKTDHWAAMELT
jgi:dihydroorotate dehydrogenase